jgi:hypothetical protein
MTGNIVEVDEGPFLVVDVVNDCTLDVRRYRWWRRVWDRIRRKKRRVFRPTRLR